MQLDVATSGHYDIATALRGPDVDFRWRPQVEAWSHVAKTLKWVFTARVRTLVGAPHPAAQYRPRAHLSATGWDDLETAIKFIGENRIEAYGYLAHYLWHTVLGLQAWVQAWPEAPEAGEVRALAALASALHEVLRYGDDAATAALKQALAHWQEYLAEVAEVVEVAEVAEQPLLVAEGLSSGQGAVTSHAPVGVALAKAVARALGWHQVSPSGWLDLDGELWQIAKTKRGVTSAYRPDRNVGQALALGHDGWRWSSEEGSDQIDSRYWLQVRVDTGERSVTVGVDCAEFFSKAHALATARCQAYLKARQLDG